MKTIAVTAVLMLLGGSCGVRVADAAGVRLREPWQKPYVGQDARGKHVLGLWTFDGSVATADDSGHKYAAQLEGAKINRAGRFGKSLESFRGWPAEDKRHRLLVRNHPALSPKGAFTLEMWINPSQELRGYPDAILLDKKYVADADYQLSLSRADRYGLRTLRASLGFGTLSQTWHSKPLTIKIGTWYHVAFTYDGAGTGRFFVNGRLQGQSHYDGLRGIAPGRHSLSIGDRVGSLFHGFPGRIDQVRISNGALEFGLARFERVSNRRVFVRMEKNTTLKFRLTNLDRKPLRDVRIVWSLDGSAGHPIPIETLPSGESRELVYQLDTRLRPDVYRLEAILSGGGAEPFSVRDTFTVQIVPRRGPDQFPVVMWGSGLNEIERLKQIGFTHALGIGADYGRIWKAGKPVAPDDPEKVRAVRQGLDDALAAGISIAASLSPGASLRSRKSLLRVDRKGKPFSGRDDICGLFPQIPRFCENVGISIARAYGDHPAFNAALLHSEVRGHARPCFHSHDFAAFRKASGIDIPREVSSPRGVDYRRLKSFPADHVVPDDDPIYTYYRWYWKSGDGWNGLNSALNRGLKSAGRDDLWTWHDPAVRVADVYGSGGDVDVISQWTYSYPDPIRIALATEELLTMAGGAAHRQQVMKMTQIIWYRSQTAPRPKKPGDAPAYRARWEREQPDAPFITIPPLHLREAFWTKIARPIKGIMYHGWQSLVPTDSTGGYRYTHPDTQHELSRLIRTVIEPLGPTLLHVPAVNSDVAFYESFAAQVFARRGTYGWNHTWIGDAWLAAMWAGLQPQVVFDETISRHGLNDYKILMMVDCDVIPQSVAEKIKAFQRRGGLIIADDHIAPAIRPDVILPPFSRTGNAHKDKAALQTIAAQIRGRLAGRYRRYLDLSTPDVIPYRRRFRQSDYVFLVNDHREYGRYVGQHRLVMENGLPSSATVSLGRSSSFVYDLVEHRAVPSRPVGNRLTLDVQLGPCDGRLFLVTDRAIHVVNVQAPASVSRGGEVGITMTVTGRDGKPIDAVIPLEVLIEDAEGRRAEFSGYRAAINGRTQFKIDIATNDSPGIWTIRVRELASGKSAVHFLRITADDS